MSYRRGKRLFKFWCMVFCLTATLGLAVTSTTGFVDDPAVFELDGNAVTNLNAGGDDWDSVNSNASVHASEILDHTGVIADFGANDQIFKTGSSKDILGINPAKGGWQWAVLSGPPDKDDLTNAYAVAYDVLNQATGNHELWAYFGTDRFDNSGDALLGFWFFQDGNVGPISGGAFGGHHTDKDILVLASFTNGGATATINVEKWSCPGLTGQNCDTKGQLVIGPTGQVCNASAPGAEVCAITNSGPTPVPTLTNNFTWNYFSKSAVTNTNTTGQTNTFPTFTFFEGGVNLSAVFGASSSTPCFSKFLAETRSSTDLTKSVNKDFVLGHFNTCNLGTNKSCGTGVLINSGKNLQYLSTININSTGFGTATFDITEVVDTVTLHHFDGSPNTYLGIPSCLSAYTTNGNACQTGTFDNLQGDTPITPPFTISGSQTYTEHFTVPDGTEAVANDVHVEASVGGATKTADFTGAQCGNPPTGTIGASKTCATLAPALVAHGSTTVFTPGSTVVAAEVQVIGTVCNNSNEQMDNVTLTDSEAGALSFTVNGQVVSSVTLPPQNIVGGVNQSCAVSNAKNYLPAGCDPNSGPETSNGACAFSDTVTPAGTDHVTGQPAPNPTAGSDTCHYCPYGFCSSNITK